MAYAIERGELGWALEHLKNGGRVQRSGWNGKGMYLFMVHANPDGFNGAGAPRAIAQAFVAMKTADGTVVPWLCSQTDLLANDWELVAPD